MNYSDYASNMQTGYSNLYGGTAAMQPYLDMLQGRGGSGQAWRSDRADRRHRDFDRHDRHEGHCHECNCHDCHRHGYDCHCSCCVRCADVLEYARCGEVRQVPVTFQNDTRRELPVKLQLGAFATDSGTQLDWQAGLSDSEFTLGPCGEKTVLVSVTVNCSAFGRPTEAVSAAGAASDTQDSASTVHSCKVAYATLSAQGCTIRPLVIALAVLPNDCGAHRAGCQCGCCC